MFYFLTFLRRLFASEPRQVRRARWRVRTRLNLEALEERAVPATLTVTTAADDGSAGSLRSEMAAAQSGDTIQFAPNLAGQTIVLQQGELDINKNLSIQGLGANQLAISGNGVHRVFEIEQGVNVTLDDLTIENGNANNESRFQYSGGGIVNQGNLTLSNSTLAGNTAYYGGGIYNYAATASISNSTLSGNSALYGGGGIFNDDATASISNSTLSGNSASYGGGGIFNVYYATAGISNSTLSGNSASYGGGIYNGSATSASLSDSIIAGNHASSYVPDVDGVFTSLGYNLIGIADGSSGFSNGSNGDLVGNAASPLDPHLGSLANNGGPTQTMALLPGSPAINAGSNALIALNPSTGQPYTTDQRGAPRIAGSAVDIGAYEVQQSSQSITFNPLPSRTYGDADFALTATASSGLPVSYSATGNATVYQDSIGNWFVHLTGAGTATITASQNGNSAYAAATPVSQTFTIAQATPTLIVSDAGGTYNGSAFPASATVNGGSSLEGVTPTLTYYSGTYTLNNLPPSGGSSTAPTNAGSYTVVATFAGSTDYASASALANFTISPANANPVVSGYSTTYDGNSHTATGTATDLNGNSLASLFDLSGTAHSNAGTYNGESWTFNAVGSANYNPNYQSASGTVNDSIAQASSTIASLSPVSVSYDGSAHGVTAPAVTGAGGLNTTATLDYVQDNADGTTTDLGSNAPVNAGSYTVTASYAGDSNHTVAANVSTTITIGQATPTVPTPTVPSNAVYNGQPQGATVGDVTGVNNADLGPPTLTYYSGTYTLSNLPGSGDSSTAPTNAGSYTVVASYAGSTDYKSANSIATYRIGQATPTVSVSDAGGTYNGSGFAAVGSAVGVDGKTAVNGSLNYAYYVGTSASGTPSATAPSNAGTYTVVATFTSSDSNYSGGTAQATFTINPATLTVTANNASRVYGLANPDFTYAISGFVNGETANVLSGSPTSTTAATASSPPGSYAITASQGTLSATNYLFSLVNGTLTVNPAPLTATGVNLNATAGAPFTGTVATFSNADPFGNAGSYTALISWGDGTTSRGLLSGTGSTLTVSGSHTFADPVSEAVSVQISHNLGYTTTVTVNDSAAVANLGQAVQPGEGPGIGFWHNNNGQALINAFNGGSSSTALANWLASTFPNLYGVNAGAHNLTGKSNAQVAAFYLSLYGASGMKLDAQVLATALNAYATTLALGGTTGQSYGFLVDAYGLDARSYNVGSNGAAFGVPNNTTLNVYQILLAANQQAVNGVLYNGNATLDNEANNVFSGINQAGGI